MHVTVVKKRNLAIVPLAADSHLHPPSTHSTNAMASRIAVSSLRAAGMYLSYIETAFSKFSTASRARPTPAFAGIPKTMAMFVCLLRVYFFGLTTQDLQSFDVLEPSTSF